MGLIGLVGREILLVRLIRILVALDILRRIGKLVDIHDWLVLWDKVLLEQELLIILFVLFQNVV